MRNPPIAIVGLGCRYPDANTPAELWQNVLAGRRAFRRMPAERLRLEDYRAEAGLADSIAPIRVAVLEGFTFDRARFRIAGSTYREVDLAHWLALDVATQALDDAGFRDGEGLPRDTTGVLLGNTLTGEFSRAHMVRLRWPYVRRVVDAALADTEWTADRRAEFLADLEGRYKEPFAPSGGETLAGGLSNTIAGRICNHYDLHGGGYTVDGACASSLLAVTTACSSLAAGDLDVALAGGVDLSLDPFELVGFSRVGVLAREEMRVYDARPTGFFPGEGCGFVVLMRADEARAQGRRIYGLVRGWGVASDGSGGTTRPEVAGQLLALDRAYRRAGFGAETVGYFEGHGTGTEVGDPVELDAIAGARARSAPANPPPCAAVGSIKANIGHTKAAAGIAGFIKATLAVHAQIVPPIPGRHEPHPRIADSGSGLRTLRRAEIWPAGVPLRAAVSAMGFGGIDTHVVIEGAGASRKEALTPQESALAASAQDAELFAFAAADCTTLQHTVRRVRDVAAALSLAEMTDLAATLHRRLGSGPCRAAVVASAPDELRTKLDALDTALDAPTAAHLDVAGGVAFADTAAAAPLRIGFLFPGQGSPSHLAGGAWRRRFDALGPLYDALPSASVVDAVATQIAQPAIVTNSLAAMRLLETLGVRANLAVGHSLGEITAYAWAGAFDDDALVRIAAARGQAMADLGSSDGAMASLAASAQDARRWIASGPVVISGDNGPRQTVVAGPSDAVDAVVAAARAEGVGATRLAVSHAFHSPLVAAATPALRAHLARETIRPLEGRVISTVLGAALPADADLAEVLCRQVTNPVRFVDAVRTSQHDVDLWIEAGPGSTLTRLVANLGSAPAIALDAGSESVAGLLRAAALVWARNDGVRLDPLFEGRFSRPFDLDRPLQFLANPCEEAPLPSSEAAASSATGRPAIAISSNSRRLTPAPAATVSASPAASPGASPLEVVRELVAAQVELPASAIHDDDRLLADLHLNSITVGQLAVDAAHRLGLPAPADPMSFAGATVAQMAQALASTIATGSGAAVPAPAAAEGVAAWVRPFVVQLFERDLPVRPRPAGPSHWAVLAAPDHPLVARLAEVLHSRGAGHGVVVCIAPEPGLDDVDLLLEGARRAAGTRGARFVVVHSGSGGGAFARSFHLESRETVTCVVDVPFDHPEAADWVALEAQNALGYQEAVYDRDGRRREPALTLLANPPPAPFPLQAGDVLLVTGGGKGIAAECALALAARYDLQLGLVGRSRPETDAALAANLARFKAAGLCFHYAVADVTDAAATRAAIGAIQSQLGPIAGFLHGAGMNEPRPVSALTREIVARTLAPKLDGARHVLAALDPAALKLFVAFGSIIARSGLRGEADYGLANEWLTRFVERYGAENPTCRSVSVEWSVWSGVGMGESLGRLDALLREGITPISPEVGVAALMQLLETALPASSVVVAGRFGDPPTLGPERAALPLLRFVGRPLVHVPGVELVVECDLSPATDPYLRDHTYDGTMLFPGVFGLEAMAQVATALVGADNAPRFENVRFLRPIAVSATEPCTLRIAALAHDAATVDVVVRSSASGFAAVHFSARCRFDAAEPSAHALTPAETNGALPLDPGRDLYGERLFQSGRFRRIDEYRLLRATECVAQIAGDGTTEWFGAYLPSAFVLGDPGARDASIHCIQACIPHAVLLPTAVERIIFADAAPGAPRNTPAGASRTVHAVERLHDGDRFVYDLEVTDDAGRTIETWEGLELRAMPAASRSTHWPWPLLAPYLERRVDELIPGDSVRVVLAQGATAERAARGAASIASAFARPVRIDRDPNGRPHVAQPHVALEPVLEVTSSHAGEFTLAVGGSPGCDLQPVEARSLLQWSGLLGPARLALAEQVARENGADLDAAATRVWAASECLRKSGWLAGAPLALTEVVPDGWIVFDSGTLRIATFATQLDPGAASTVIAVLKRSADARV